MFYNTVYHFHEQQLIISSFDNLVHNNHEKIFLYCLLKMLFWFYKVSKPDFVEKNIVALEPDFGPDFKNLTFTNSNVIN